MTPDELRSAFLQFFEDRRHQTVASSPVVPEGDPTLLFTNAGMNQFKDVLLGLETRDYKRAASAQKCIRAGGKHNDLDEVGKDSRHLTFFEMLGNWSFGDYGKAEAIRWAWEFVTGPLALPPERLYVSVYRDDDESWTIWTEEVGLPPERVIRLGHVEEGDEENFWSMGPTGPCGPCTEIYVDHHPGQGAARWEVGFDEDRFLEIWNLVFMQYDRAEDGTMAPLPMMSVDTGMGLERVLALLEGVDHVFHTSVFTPILEHTASLLGMETDARSLWTHEHFTAFCVIADHIRTLAFCVSEGAAFSNDGRGYVLRRILRRAVRYGRTLGFEGPFLYRVAEAVVRTFGATYPELRWKQRETATVIRQEEERFFRTLDRGIALFDELVEETVARNEDALSGDGVFKLYDTFGFPPDLTRIMAEERGLTVDEAGYQTAMETQRERSRAADHRYEAAGAWITLEEGVADRFVGYRAEEQTTAVLRYRPTEPEGHVDVCLRETPFYAESGGQVGDTGVIESTTGTLRLAVLDTQKTTAGITHHCKVIEGTLTPENLQGEVLARVDGVRRAHTKRNHTATHLLHGALHEIVSETAFQRGSLVAPDRLRFDFALDRPVTADELKAIEQRVNESIRANLPLNVHSDIPLAEAEAMGAMMIFGEKYGASVRVIEIPQTSTELCGGIHVSTTGDIAWFRILSESGVAAGIRRIEAVTGVRAFELAEQERRTIQDLSEELRSPTDQLLRRVQNLQTEVRQLEKAVQELQRQQALSQSADLLEGAVDVGGVSVLAKVVDAPDRDALLSLADSLRERAPGPLALLLAASVDNKPALLVALSDALLQAGSMKAPALLQVVAPCIDGRGGGKPHLAQAGGKRLEGLPEAVAQFPEAVRALLG